MDHFSHLFKSDHHSCSESSIGQNDDSPRISLQGNPEVLAQLNMINLTQKDLELIAGLRPVVVEQIEQITASFYEAILHVDSLKEIITSHTTVNRLRQTLSSHLIEMFDGRIDEAFVEKRMRIAMVHQKSGCPRSGIWARFKICSAPCCASSIVCKALTRTAPVWHRLSPSCSASNSSWFWKRTSIRRGWRSNGRKRLSNTRRFTTI